MLDDDARRHWDGVDLGPTHVTARAVARALRAARAGDPPCPLPGSPDVVMTTLPLPWSVELAARAAAVRPGEGIELAAGLADWAGEAVRAELERLTGAAHQQPGADGRVGGATAAAVPRPVAQPDDAVRAGARRLLDVLAAEDGARVRIELLGPARVLLDGVPVDAPTCDAAGCARCWPSSRCRGRCAATRSSRRCGRTTTRRAGRATSASILSRLRHVLEPAPLPWSSSGRCCSSTATPSPWRTPAASRSTCASSNRALAEADRAHAAGDATAQAEHLERAVALWRGEPLVDLEALAGRIGDIEAVRRSLVEAALRMGEVRLAAGRTRRGPGLRRAGTDRVALRRACPPARDGGPPATPGPGRGARRRRGDRGLLDDLGVPPEDATAMVIRQVAAPPRAGPHGGAPGRGRSAGSGGAAVRGRGVVAAAGSAAVSRPWSRDRTGARCDQVPLVPFGRCHSRPTHACSSCTGCA